MEFDVEVQLRHPQPGEELLIPAGTVHSPGNVGAKMLAGCSRVARLQICSVYRVVTIRTAPATMIAEPTNRLTTSSSRNTRHPSSTFTSADV